MSMILHGVSMQKDKRKDDVEQSTKMKHNKRSTNNQYIQKRKSENNRAPNKNKHASPKKQNDQPKRKQNKPNKTNTETDIHIYIYIYI